VLPTIAAANKGEQRDPPRGWMPPTSDAAGQVAAASSAARGPPPRLGQRELRDLLVRGPVLPMPSAVGAMLAGAVSSFTMQGVSSSGEVGY